MELLSVQRKDFGEFADSDVNPRDEEFLKTIPVSAAGVSRWGSCGELTLVWTVFRVWNPSKRV